MGKFVPPMALPENGNAVKGQYFFDEYVFSYSINLKTKGFYEIGGTLTMRNAATHKPLQILKMEEKTQKMVTALASTPIHVRHSGVKDVEKEIELRAKILISQYGLQFAEAAKNGKTLEEMTLKEALFVWGDETESAICKRADKRKENLSRIEKIAEGLGNKQIEDIKKSDLKKALPEAVTVATLEQYTKALKEFLEYIENKQRTRCCLSGYIKEIEEQVEKGKKEEKRNRDERNAANSDVLTEDCEVELNERILKEYKTDCKFVALALIKGGGLSTEDIINLKVGDIITEKQNDEKVFVKLKRDYSSATQNYIFPLFPWEARLIKNYLLALEAGSGGNLDPEWYFLSTDGGHSPITTDDIVDLCKIELQRYKFGAADRLEKVDLSRDKGVRLLQKTYRNRLEEYCGVTAEYDEGALLFLLHHSLRKSVQADHYRSFTSESGRACMYNYVRQDRRFIEEPVRRKKQYHRTEGENVLYTLPRSDSVNQQQAVIETELEPGKDMEIIAEGGATLVVEFME